MSERAFRRISSGELARPSDLTPDLALVRAGVGSSPSLHQVIRASLTGLSTEAKGKV